MGFELFVETYNKTPRFFTESGRLSSLQKNHIPARRFTISGVYLFFSLLSPNPNLG